MNTEDIYQLLDLTYLKDEAPPSAILKLSTEGLQKNVAALCVWPENLKDIPKSCFVQKASVVNFPSGQQELSEVLGDIEMILKAFPHTEIDYVFPYTSYLKGQEQKAIKHCQAVVDYCHKHQSLVKVILETGAFPDEKIIFKAACQILKTNCDFLKTSTGKIAIGATPKAVAAICDAIKENQSSCGIKVSGGIKNINQAKDYLFLIQSTLNLPLNAKYIRLGCSQLSEINNESHY